MPCHMEGELCANPCRPSPRRQVGGYGAAAHEVGKDKPLYVPAGTADDVERSAGEQHAHWSACLDLCFGEEHPAVADGEVGPAERLDIAQSQSGVDAEVEGPAGALVGDGRLGESGELFAGERGSLRLALLAVEEFRDRGHGVGVEEAVVDGEGQQGVEPLQVGSGAAGRHPLGEVAGQLMDKVGVDIGELWVFAREGVDVGIDGVADLCGMRPHVVFVEADKGAQRYRRGRLSFVARGAFFLGFIFFVFFVAAG